MSISQPPTEENPPKPGSAPRPRIQTLADLIFGLALSIGAVSLVNTKPTNLNALIGSLLLFGFSFLILALVWFRYTRIMSALPVETELMLITNFFLLFLVSIEPYLFGLITTQPNPGQLDPGITTAAYAVDLGLMNLILAYFLQELTREDRKLIPKDLLRSYRLQRYSSVVTAAVFLVSAIPIFTLYERITLWILTFVAYPARRFLNKRRGGISK